MSEFIQYYPNAAPLIGDLYAKAMDWPGAEEVSERLEFLLPPEVKKQKEDAEIIRKGGTPEPEEPTAPDPEVIMQQQQNELKLQEGELKLKQGELKLQEAQISLQDTQIQLQEQQVKLEQENVKLEGLIQAMKFNIIEFAEKEREKANGDKEKQEKENTET